MRLAPQQERWALLNSGTFGLVKIIPGAMEIGEGGVFDVMELGLIQLLSRISVATRLYQSAMYVPPSNPLPRVLKNTNANCPSHSFSKDSAIATRAVLLEGVSS